MATDRERAVQLRAEGLSYPKIAAALGVSRTTVYRWVNPGYEEHQRRISLAWKDRNREANRAKDRERRAKPDYRGTCTNPACAGLRGVGDLEKRPGARGYCAGCVHAIAEVRRSLIAGMWDAGWMVLEIADVGGWGMGTLAKQIALMRKQGWDLPYRYNVAKGHQTAQ